MHESRKNKPSRSAVVRLAAVAAALCLAGPGSAWAAGGSKTPEPARPTSPAEDAMALYNQGLDRRNEAWSLTGKLDGASPDKRQKLEARIEKAYANAAADFERAIAKNPQMHQAHSSLGYARRQLGDFEGALRSYDRALALAPDYAEAVEYRAEAYLGLNRIDDAKQSYERLAELDDRLAADLLLAMRNWIDARRAEPRGAKVGQLDSLERWIDGLGDEPANVSSMRKGSGW